MDKEHVVLFKETYDKNQEELKNVKEEHNKSIGLIVAIVQELNELGNKQQINILNDLFRKLDIRISINGREMGTGSNLIKLNTL